MARFTEDDFAALQAELDRDGARALGDVRRASGEQRNQATEAWLAAGDNLTEKAIAALDTGGDARAATLVRRIVALPVVDEETRAGLMAVGLVLYSEVVEPSFDEDSGRGLLDLPLQLLPTLAPAVADELRRVLATLADFDMPAGVLRRVQSVVALERRFDAPFASVPEKALPDAVTGVLRLILRLRSDEG